MAHHRFTVEAKDGAARSGAGEHHGAMDRALLEATLDRAPVNDDGRSGAVLERVFLADGSRVVVKRFDPTVDMVMRLSGDTTGREVELVRRGVFDGLPTTVLHPVVDAWYDDEGRGVLIMRDLGDSVLTWKSIVSPEQARTMFAAIADLHAAFLGSATDGLTPLDLLLGLFEPRRIRPYASEALIDYALRGWEYWPEVAPGEVGERVLALAQDTTALTAACQALPTTLLHGDLATVNMAFEADRPGCLTLIDWGLAAAGPAELDIGRLLAGCAQLFGPVGSGCERDDRGPARRPRRPAARGRGPDVRRRRHAAGSPLGPHLAGVEQGARHRRASRPGRSRAGTCGAAVVAAPGRAGVRDRPRMRGTRRWT